jgi:hypothetical protein
LGIMSAHATGMRRPSTRSSEIGWSIGHVVVT